MMTCPHCGERVPTNNFCDMCGQPLCQARQGILYKPAWIWLALAALLILGIAAPGNASAGASRAVSAIGTYTRDDARWGTVTLTIAPDRRVTVESKQGDDCPNTADFHCWEVLRNDEQVIEAWSMYCDQPQHCHVERYATVAVAFAADYSALTLYGVTQGQYWHSDFTRDL